MPSFLIRVEAVNFRWITEDTQDLSTIRGGSMMMAYAHDLVERSPQWQLVTHGASQSFWRVKCHDRTAAEEECNKLAAAFAQHRTLRHGTFAVDLIEESGETSADIAQLRTLNRWHQYQQPTVRPPEPANRAADPRGGTFCKVDLTRPATTNISHEERPKWVSFSVRDRRQYGRDQKQAFYRKALPSFALPFAHDLDAITSRETCAFTRETPDPLKRLDGKMAVLYLDGNRQAEMAATYDIDKLDQFRAASKHFQELFLRDLLESIAREPPPPEQRSSDWIYWDEPAEDEPQREPQHVVRLETLVWGGDDIVLVTPAWKAWDVLRLFFDHVLGVREGTTRWTFLNRDFTYSAGLVLCSRKASIHRMKALASKLMVEGKKNHGEQPRRTYQNLIAYEVLESFDAVVDEIAKWRDYRLSTEKGGNKALLLEPGQLSDLAELVRRVRRGVNDDDSSMSRRRLETLARQTRRKEPTDASIEMDIQAAFGKAWPLASGAPLGLSPRQALHHVVALWDYIDDAPTP